jgi:hypothetical protein
VDALVDDVSVDCDFPAIAEKVAANHSSIWLIIFKTSGWADADVLITLMNPET